MSWGGYIPGYLMWPLWCKSATDDELRRPLWEFPTDDARKAVVHERRVRWGVDDDEGLDHG
jgi:hypothetical protein